MYSETRTKSPSPHGAKEAYTGYEIRRLGVEGIHKETSSFNKNNAAQPEGI